MRPWIVAVLAVAASLVHPFTPAHAEDDGGLTPYADLLARYVVSASDGITRVDYRRWRATDADRASLAGFIASQAQKAPSRLPTAERLAYWANLYNAITLKVILDRYPVASIRDIKSDGVWLDPKAFTGPWVAKRVTVEGRELSLDDIEHKILRPEFKDPRVHYAVNCASLGCPNLAPKPWHAATLQQDLDAAARAYVNHPRGARIEANGALVVSSIYAWFKTDFGGDDAGVIQHLRKYAEPPLQAALARTKAIARDHYDWAINDFEAEAKSR